MTYTPHTVWVHPVIWCEPEPKAEPVRRAAYRECTKERNAFIIEKRRSGMKYKDIAPYTGLSITQCQNIFKSAQC